MRILIFTDTFLPQINGVVTYIVETSKLLAKRGHKILIFAPKIKDNDQIDLGDGIKVKTIPSVGLPTYKEYKIALPVLIRDYKAIADFKPDIVHVQSPFSLGLEGVVAAKRLKKPVVATYHTLIPEFVKYYLPFPSFTSDKLMTDMTWVFTKLFHDQCDLVIAPSEIMKKVLIDHDVKAPAEAMSNGIDLVRFKPETKSARRFIKEKFGLGKVTLVHVGRMSHEKNSHLLIKAFAAIKNKTNDDVKLLVIGDGPTLPKLKKMAAELKIENRVIFTGYMTRQFMVPFLKASDIFLTASTMETQGIVVLEAMASGLPVIGADSMAVPELVKDGVNGYLFKAGDTKKISERMLKLIKSEKLREKMGAESLRLVKEHSIDITIRKLEGIYRRLSKGRRK